MTLDQIRLFSERAIAREKQELRDRLSIGALANSQDGKAIERALNKLG